MAPVFRPTLRGALLGVFVAWAACGSRPALIADGESAPGDAAPQPPGDPPGADCPRVVPELGSACSIEGQVCPFTYEHRGCDTCAVEPTEYLTVVRCEQRRWGWIAHRVSDPVCPATAPREAQTCSSAQKGLECFYGSPRCAASAIVQCDGQTWRELNPCPTRATVSCQLGISPPEEDMVRLGESYVHQLSVSVFPALSCLGTQVSVAHTAFEEKWGLSDLFVMSHSVSPVKADTRAVTGFSVDRLLLAYLAREETSNMVEGLVALTVPLQVTLERQLTNKESMLVIDEQATDVLDLLVHDGRAYLAYEQPGTSSTPGHPTRAVSLATWELDRGAQTLKRTVLFDEAQGGMNCDGGCPIVARLALSPKGPVVAFVRQGPGVLVYEPPDLVIRQLAAHTPDVVLTLATPPDSLSMAPLADGSLLLALFAEHHMADAPTLCDQLQLSRVSAAGKVTSVACPEDQGRQGSPYAPQVAAFEDGWALAWRTSDRQPALSVAFFNDAGHSSRIQIPSSAGSLKGPFVLGASPLNRSLHLAWSTEPPNFATGGSGYQLRHQRLICTGD